MDEEKRKAKEEGGRESSEEGGNKARGMHACGKQRINVWIYR